MGEIFVVVEHRKGEIREIPLKCSLRPGNFAGPLPTR
jgi:hypothetical protein